MTVLYENIDPNGDTLIIISYLAVLTQSADEPVAAEEPAAAVEPLAVEEPAAAYEPDHIDGHSTLSSIDGTTHCHEGLGERLSERLKVSKKHLTVASRRARVMFQRDYRESRETEVDGLYHWRIEPLFDSEALRIVMKVVHAQAQDLPDEVTLQMIVSIAEVVDDLQCHDALSFFVKVWINRLSESVPSQMCDELVQWIFVASVFGLDEKFKQATRVAIMRSTGPIDILGLPMRPGIFDKIEQKRQDLLEDLIAQLNDVLNNLCSDRSCRVLACRLMMLGALTHEMKNTNLHSPRPARPFRNQSLSSALEAVRQFDSPSLYLPSEGIYHYSFDEFDSSFQGSKEDVWVLQKDTLSSSRRKKKDRGLFDAEDDEQLSKTPKRLTFHCCRLQAHLEPVIDLLEAKVFTLDIGGF
ncbi:het-d [Fusarium acutatum]|uniref:Het-d n=1 Tax=Fusarium acutatum TaxID=78861 RepID=A0A8H4NDF6_9HYPO|nr:het-d [Fusarium acutatum]